MYLVSSCLAGVNCRYNGSNSEDKVVADLVKEGKAVAICPEIIAGLPSPRPSCELSEDSEGNIAVISDKGEDFTEEFVKGSEMALEIAEILGIRKAILQSRSPTCGCGLIYDGKFSGKLIEGNGLFAELLIKSGIEVCTEDNLDRFGL